MSRGGCIGHEGVMRRDRTGIIRVLSIVTRIKPEAELKAICAIYNF